VKRTVMCLAKRIDSTESPDSGADIISEPRLITQFGRVREVVKSCVRKSEFRQSEQ